jgi:hypothetical protein
MIVPKLFAIKLHRTLLSIRGLDAIKYRLPVQP